MSLEACLPAELRGPTTTITRVGVGQSGAGVYRVDAAGGAFVLKIAGDAEPLAAWQRKAAIQQAAADAGVAPRVVHVDETRRAIVSAFVVDRGFAPRVMNPATRAGAIAQLGRTLRRVHDLPPPAGAIAQEPRAVLSTIASALAGFAVPRFVGDAIERALATVVPPADRAPVLSHNDVNPTNLVDDGERLLLLDWETAGEGDPLYDLAAIAMFFRFDDAACAQLVAAHDDAPVTTLPARFIYVRHLVAVLCGAAFLHVARGSGHAGSTAETLEATPSLADFYQRLRAGAVNLGTPDGRWSFGLALLKASFEL